LTPTINQQNSTILALGSGFDPEELQSELNEIEEDITRFQTVQGQCTEIRKSRERIEETLDRIESDIQNRLTVIEAELTKASEG
jgi:16S rRNA C1402 (ribose-2'-O) methylase RsmI